VIEADVGMFTTVFLARLQPVIFVGKQTIVMAHEASTSMFFVEEGRCKGKVAAVKQSSNGKGKGKDKDKDKDAAPPLR
jgi:hypothetical protein